MTDKKPTIDDYINSLCADTDMTSAEREGLESLLAGNYGDGSTIKDFINRIIYNKKLKGTKAGLAKRLKEEIVSEENRLFIEDPMDFIRLLAAKEDAIIYLTIIGMESDATAMILIKVDKIKEE